jgi:hypothetical protein
MCLQVFYGVIMRKERLATVRLNTSHRCHRHYESDTMDITGGRFRLLEDEEQREICAKCNGMKTEKSGDYHNLERRVGENKKREGS